MKSVFLMGLSIMIVLTTLASSYSYGQTSEELGKELLIREALEIRKAVVAVEGHLTGDILEAKVSAMIRGVKPKIYNIIIEGPRLGALIPVTIKSLYAVAEEEEPYPTGKKGGFISFGDDKETRKLKGWTSR